MNNIENQSTPSSSEETQKTPIEKKNKQQEIIQKLLQNKQTKEYQNKKGNSLNTWDTRSLSAHEVKSMRYKIYTLLVLVVGAIIRIQYLYPLINEYTNNTNTINEEKEATAILKRKQKAIAKKEKFGQTIEKQKKEITGCTNLNQNCKNAVSKILPYEKNTKKAQTKAQYFLQIGDLSDPKLLVDERSILTNIDLFLLRSDKENKIGKSFGEIQQITIGDPQIEQEKIHSVEINTIIRFANQEGLLQFLINTENRIITNNKIKLPPILYKIEEVTYDIAKHDKEQDAAIKLIAYYLKK